MKSRRTLWGLGAMTVAAVILAGFTAKTLNHHRKHISGHMLQKSSTHPGTPTSNDSKQLLSWLETTTLPILHDARAVPDLGHKKLELSHPARSKVSRSPLALNDICHPNWRPGATDSVGRGVANICPGTPLLVLKSQYFHAPVMLQLPSVAVFNSVLQGEQFDRAFLPSSIRAERAGRAALQMLGNREGLRLAQAPIPSPETVPYLNPLGWSVPKHTLGG